MTDHNALSFLLNDFVDRVPQVAHVVAVSADGLLIACNRMLPVDKADAVAAAASGLVSLLRGAAAHFEAGMLEHNLTGFGGGFMFLKSVGSGASLVVLAGLQCDIGQVTYELTDLINKVGAALTPAARAGLVPPAGPGR